RGTRRRDPCLPNEGLSRFGGRQLARFRCGVRSMRSTLARTPEVIASWSFARRRAIRYLAVLVAGGLVATAVAIALQVHDHRQVDTAQAQARDRATQLLTDVLSY